jgi:hypothetical protein
MPSPIIIIIVAGMLSLCVSPPLVVWCGVVYREITWTRLKVGSGGGLVVDVDDNGEAVRAYMLLR